MARPPRHPECPDTALPADVAPVLHTTEGGLGSFHGVSRVSALLQSVFPQPSTPFVAGAIPGSSAVPFRLEINAFGA